MGVARKLALAVAIAALSGCAAIEPALTRYFSIKDVPEIRDADGNVIPTSPDAYDVSSATGERKK